MNFNIHLKAFYCVNEDLPTSLVLEQPVCERALCVTLIFDLQLYHLQKRQLWTFSWHDFGISCSSYLGSWYWCTDNCWFF